MERHPTYGIGIGLFVIGHIVGLVLLGIALRRSRVVPRLGGLGGRRLPAAALRGLRHPGQPGPRRDRRLGPDHLSFLAVGVAIARTRNDDVGPPAAPRLRTRP